MFMRCFVVMAFLASFSAWAQQPTPGPLPKPSADWQPNHKPEEAKQKATAKSGGADQLRGPEEEHTRKEADKSAGKAPDNPISAVSLSNSDIIAIVTCIVGTLQFFALVWTILVMKASSQRQLRAYVFLQEATPLDGATCTPPDQEHINTPYVRLKIVNSGQTTAYNVVTWAALEVADNGDESRLVVPKLTKEFPMNLGNSCAMPKTAVLPQTRALTEAEIAGISSCKKSIYLYGRVEYEDVFRIKRFTNFRLYCNGPYPFPIAKELSFCQRGNETELDG
jgi:hypothetical protein